MKKNNLFIKAIIINQDEIPLDIDFSPLFKPKSVAIFGAKDNRAGYILPFKEMNFQGKVFLLSESEQELYGFKCYKNIFDFPDPIDFAIIAIRPEYVLQAIKDCQQKGVKFVHIFTAGFKEKDSRGKKIEDEILQIIKDKGSRIIGPNCMGIYCPEGRISFGPSLLPESGPVALLSQSGALAFQFIFDGLYRGFKFSKVVSFGNQIDLTLTDFLEYLEKDPQTKIICIYSEGIMDGQKLIRILKKMSKPVIILKGGMTQAGKRAAKSHTGSIAGNAEIMNSIFKQTPAIPAESLSEMADIALAFIYSPFLPKSNKIAIMTFSGGSGVLESDACSKLGLEFPQFPEQIKQKMRKYFPAWINPQNPLDLPSIFRKPRMIDIFRTLAISNLVDAVIIEAPGRMADPYWNKVRKRDPKSSLENLIKGGKILREHKKLYFVSTPPSYFYQQRENLKNLFLSEGFPVFYSISDAARAVLKMNQYFKRQQRKH